MHAHASLPFICLRIREPTKIILEVTLLMLLIYSIEQELNKN